TNVLSGSSAGIINANTVAMTAMLICRSLCGGRAGPGVTYAGDGGCEHVLRRHAKGGCCRSDVVELRRGADRPAFGVAALSPHLLPLDRDGDRLAFKRVLADGMPAQPNR